MKQQFHFSKLMLIIHLVPFIWSLWLMSIKDLQGAAAGFVGVCSLCLLVSGICFCIGDPVFNTIGTTALIGYMSVNIIIGCFEPERWFSTRVASGIASYLILVWLINQIRLRYIKKVNYY